MDILKERVINVVDAINQNWVNEIEESIKENRKPNSITMMGKFSESIKKLDTAFREYEERHKKKSKGGFFNR